MPGMNETQFHQEGDEITDSTSFSLMALAGFLGSLVGMFSVGYYQILPVSIVSTLLGAATLVTAKRFRLNLLSKFLGLVGVVIGATATSWGISERWLETYKDVSHAREIAKLYLESLSTDDLDKVYYLVGFQFEGESNEERDGAKLSEVRRAKTRLDQDQPHVEIRNRKTPAKWVFVGLDGEFQGTVGHTYRLRYRDEGQTIPPEYWVYARKDCNKFESKDKVHWFVDNLENVKK
ncbi:MAG: hypothetical protein ACK553_12050 [Planctomycetota bacterium]